jgi:hypothetical protein
MATLMQNPLKFCRSLEAFNSGTEKLMNIQKNNEMLVAVFIYDLRNHYQYLRLYKWHNSQ